MKDLLENIIKSPQMPDYYNHLKTIVETEHEKRLRFREEINEDDKAEFINGEIVMHSPAKNKHLFVSGNVFNIMSIFVNFNNLGKTYVEKAMIGLKRNDYEPDLCFFKKEKAENFTNDMMIFPAPDLVVEILSKKTKNRDRVIKFQDYAANNISEYWIIDPDLEIVEQYILFENEYILIMKTNNEILISQQIAGLKIPTRAIFDILENTKLIESFFSKK